MHALNKQVELMQRLQDKAGQQRVVVEHVNVREGGQAIQTLQLCEAPTRSGSTNRPG